MLCYLIPPLNHLSLMNKGDSYFCLAHLYMANKEYKDFFLARRAEGKFVTLDNGAAERSLVTIDNLIDIVKELKPNEVIAPDVLFDYKKTISNLHSFVQRLTDEKLIDKVNIFAVPQGVTKEEWLKCYKKMLVLPVVKTIGLSKISVSYCWGNRAVNDQHIKKARRSCISYLKLHDLLAKPIHCLGMGDPTEFLAYKNNSMIRSTDSCYTILSALKGVEFTNDKVIQRIKTTNDYFDATLNSEQLILAEKNIDFLRKIVKKGI